MRAAALLAVLTAFPALAQLVQTGPDDPNYCYKVEKISPNLRLSKLTLISGTIKDQTLAPFPNSRVELRKYISDRQQLSIEVVSTDKAGHFDLGVVKPGHYRLLASPIRAFAQPTKLSCPADGPCDLKIVLTTNPTDTPTSVCPIR